MKQKVVLVHGYFKNEKDMFALKSKLEKAAFEVLTINLPLTFKKLKSTLPLFKKEIEKIISELNAAEKIHFVGHSTGGLLIRRFLAVTEDKDRIGRIVLIAAPNKGSRLAGFARKYFKPFTDIFKTLSSIEHQNVRRLELAAAEDFEMAAIAGNKCNLLLGRLLSKENDGRVRVESVKIPKLKEFVVLPYGHKDIHYQEQTANLVANFLNFGRFNGEDKIE
ncbi:MAG: lipase family alpha/beta hydrolase [Halanaerobium sp.]